MNINKVAVIGSGVMGSGIAAQVTNAGMPVVLLDIKVEGKDLAADAVKRMLKTDTVTLVNLVADSRYVPEYLGAACRADLIAPALAKLWQDPTLQDQAMALSMVRLGQGAQPPGIRAAQSIMDFLAKQ